MNKRQVSIVGQLRKAIREAEQIGMTRYKLAQVSGVEQAVLSKLVRHEGHSIGYGGADRNGTWKEIKNS